MGIRDLSASRRAFVVGHLLRRGCRVAMMRTCESRTRSPTVELLASPRRQDALLCRLRPAMPGARWAQMPPRPGAPRYPEVTGPLAVMTSWEAVGLELEEVSHLPCLIIPTPVELKLNRPEPLIPV
jgi:hypothetical protein